MGRLVSPIPRFYYLDYSKVLIFVDGAVTILSENNKDWYIVVKLIFS